MESIEFTCFNWINFTIRATKGKLFTVDWGDGTKMLRRKGCSKSIYLHHCYKDGRPNWESEKEYTVTISALDETCMFSHLDIHISSVFDLDITKSPSLIYVDCSRTLLSELNTSQNRQLKLLNCSGNFIEQLDISNNESLVALICVANRLTQLEVSNNKNLKWLLCRYNQLKNVITDNIKLDYLDLDNIVDGKFCQFYQCRIESAAVWEEIWSPFKTKKKMRYKMKYDPAFALPVSSTSDLF